ncbi:hypothetical protein KEM55_003300 [Ascosphaera atra]|nr:hypothetical protein KEM55_003300 [Ascosphaera atra]
MYYRNAQAALVVYDITKPSSLTKAKHWVAELQRQASPGIVIALVGNKLDLTNEVAGGEEPEPTPAADDAGADIDAEGDAGAEGEQSTEDEGQNNADNEAPGRSSEDQEGEAPTDARKISTREASTYADEEGLLFFETSAKSGKNVTEVFTAIANAIPETNLKSSRTGTGVGGAGGVGSGNLGARAGQQGRVDLRERGAETKSDCAC